MTPARRAGVAAAAVPVVAVGLTGFLVAVLAVLRPVPVVYPWRGPDDERVVALTFDDGPNEPYTSQIAEVLKDRGVRATFFQVGWCVGRCPTRRRRSPRPLM